MRLVLLLTCLVGMTLCLTEDDLDCSYTLCSECIRHPTCFWCLGNGNQTKRPHCMSKSHVGACDAEKVDLENTDEVIKDEVLSADGNVENIVQIRPQEVNLKLRIQEPYNISLTYKHMANYPADIYYMLDGSKSMEDDKNMLHSLQEQLVRGIRNITINFHLGFGVFFDKPVLPFASAAKIDTPAYSFKNVLPLTNNTSAFSDEVKKAKVATNEDFPEGGFDGLLQAIVCEDDIKWRDVSVRVIVFSTDAGFHMAGDGKLAGILKPNDKKCHLEDNEYRKATIYDYPSVAQINEMAKLHRINLVFAITSANEPLYARLSQHIEGATCGVLLNNSSNVVDLLTNSVKDIISKVELKERDHNTHVSVRYFSECKDGEMKERASCKELEVGDEVKFLAEVTATKCPDNEKDWNPVIDVYPMGRQSSLKINLEMQCQCSCAKPGDKDYIEKADLCNKTGDLKCGVCDCYAGFAGNSCECKISEADTISEDGCRETNTSAVCSNRGRCICGKCMCGTQKDPKEKIYGEYCQCTNYECDSSGGEICSGHGECECNKCKCSDGWKGKNCACNKGTDSCKNPDTGEICSNHGACECNKCTCTPKYFGKFCEDCQTCSGKCSEFKQCVQCKVFNTGELNSEQCYVDCDRYNITVVKEFAKDLNKEQKKCSFFDENDCLFNFVYEVIEDSNNVSILVKQDLECLEPVNTKGVIFGVIGAVLAIGLLTLVIWKVCAILKDQQEYARFLRSRDAAKWSNNENPLYRTARITIQNPLFNLHN